MKSTTFKYDCYYGYIRGAYLDDGFVFIDKFVIYPRYRGRGLARRLAEKLPQAARLLAHPLYNMKRTGSEPDSKGLIAFYKSLGFKLVPNKYGNHEMERKP